MDALKSVIILCSLAQSVSLASATDITGTWVSKYSFGSVGEVMIASTKQAGEDSLGSLSFKPSVGSAYPEAIFRTVNCDQAKLNHLSRIATRTHLKLQKIE